MDDRDSASPIDSARVIRAAVRNQMLFTAGDSLTTGGFLYYFAYELGARDFLFALLLIIPETVAVSGLATRWIVQQTGQRKRVWIACSIAARIIALGIPLLAFPQFRVGGDAPVWTLAGILAVSQALQAIAFIAYLSWLSDLVPDYQWGKLLARRDIGKLIVLLVVPVAGGLLRDTWRKEASPDTVLWAYVATYSIGTLLALLSLIPLLKFPNVSTQSRLIQLPQWELIVAAFRDKSLRCLLLHNWCLAFANGLTQSAFYQFRIGPLGISLAMFYVLESVMNTIKIPVSAAAGFVSDRFGNKWLLFWSVIVASCGLVFWLAASPAHWWWLFGAYVLWGAYAAANISGQNLLLQLAPRSDNTAHLALFREIGGLVAGLSGLLGGIWLTRLQSTDAQQGSIDALGSFQTVFAVSLIGRLASALWIVPIREPGAKSLQWMATSMSRTWRRRG